MPDLSALRRSRGATVPPAEDRLSDFAFAPNPGALRGRRYLPAGLPAGAPVVVVLHGCTQSAAGYDHASGWSRLADVGGFALLFPEQTGANNPNRCFNWFQPGDSRRGQGEAASVMAMIDRLIADHALDRRRVFVTGLSAGGAMAVTLLAAYPERFAAGAIIAGLPHGAAHDVPSAFEAMRGGCPASAAELGDRVRSASPHKGPWPLVSVWHGDADRTVAPANAEALVAQWLDVHGLDSTAPTTDRIDGQWRRVWRDARGRPLVEDVRIAGLGHGTPLACGGADALGNAAPYMLEAGISSTRHIARRWGLATGSEATARPRPAPVRAASRAAPARDSVARIIEDALRAAGLRR